MASNDGQIVFEVEIDDRDAMQDIRGITQRIQRETRQWSDAGTQASDEISGGFSGALKKIGGAIAAAKIGEKLLQIGKDAIQAASDLQEVQNVVDSTFGANSSKIDEWAKNAGTQFGLTETQAKRFTSTLGAMMKSSGVAGNEIVNMSTDLAGLAADMASFYNLDFDTAFQKIRSGISGETEPLKQLGINMSVANLNAYALKQGLEKTFEQMSQGEQVMLRYQYMMDATADAQGDFAKTSDGYANSMRTLQTNIEELKAKIGTGLLDSITQVVTGVNKLFGKEAEQKYNDFSLLDKISEINIQKEEKIAQITEIAEEANALIEVLGKLTGKDSETIGTLAGQINSLESDSLTQWSGILKTLRGIDGLENLFGEGATADQAITDLASALAGTGVTKSKADAWDTFLSALADNSGAVSKLTGDTAEGTKEWLESLAATAKQLSPDDAKAWDTLMNALVSGLSMGQSQEGQDFVEALAAQFLAMGSNSEEAVKGLAALGYGTTEIEAKQAAWLAVCKELNQTIPGISDLIDDQTGEIKGGLPALREYVDAWQQAQKAQAEYEAMKAYQTLYNQENNIGTKQGQFEAARMTYIVRARNAGFDEETARASAKKLEDLFKEGKTKKDLEDELNELFSYETLKGGLPRGSVEDLFLFSAIGKDDMLKEAFEDLVDKAQRLIVTEREIDDVNAALQKSTEELKAEAEAAGMTVAEYEESLKQAAQAESVLERAAKGEESALEQVTNAVNGAKEALEGLADYANKAYEASLQAINSVAKGLNGVDYQGYGKIRDKIHDLTVEQSKYTEGSDEWNSVQAQIDKLNESLITTSRIQTNLSQQTAFLDEYLANLQKAREWGLSDELLAELSDGSVESAEYLSALVNGDKETAQEIDKQYQEIQKKKEQLAQELSQQTLTVDQVYQTMAEKAKEAVEALDLEGEAKDNTGKTIGGIAQGIGEKIPDVKEAVDGIIQQLERLDGFGIDIDFGGFGHITFTTSTGTAEGSARMGLFSVPHDDYLARLHEGERVLSAQEAQQYNSLLYGGYSGFSLDELGGVMRDNVRPGGNVYLDGRVVGSVISDQQGKSYRQLQRSGWQK